MQKITYPAALIRAAQQAQAKNDAHYYLNGLLLAADGTVSGTDGHLLFKGTVPSGPDTATSDVIVKIEGTIPANAETVTFMFEDALGGVCRTNTKKAFTFEVVEGTFPDISKVIPSLPRANHASGFTMDATLIGRLPDILGKGAHCSFYPGNQNESVLVEYHGAASDPLEGSIVVIMPMKARGDFQPL